MNFNIPMHSMHEETVFIYPEFNYMNPGNKFLPLLLLMKDVDIPEYQRHCYN